MPALPTFTVTDAAANRLLAAFDGTKDAQGAAIAPTLAYKIWLQQGLIAFVLHKESQAVRAALETEIRNGLPLT